MYMVMQTKYPILKQVLPVSVLFSYYNSYILNVILSSVF